MTAFESQWQQKIPESNAFLDHVYRRKVARPNPFGGTGVSADLIPAAGTPGQSGHVMTRPQSACLPPSRHCQPRGKAGSSEVCFSPRMWVHSGTQRGGALRRESIACWTGWINAVGAMEDWGPEYVHPGPVRGIWLWGYPFSQIISHVPSLASDVCAPSSATEISLTGLLWKNQLSNIVRNLTQ